MNRSIVRQMISATSLVACTLFGAPAMAAYSDVIFFGDSLSDTGNVLSLTTAFGATPFPNFVAAPGRFSNGPVWTETLATGLGFAAAAAPSNLIFNGSAVVPIGVQGGHNFSFGGARTGLGGSAGATTGLIGQLIAWNGAAFSTSLTRAADPNALYVVVAGGNDLRDFRSGSAAALNPLQAATNVVNAVGLLAQAGAEHFLISTMPDLGRTPEAVALGLIPESTSATLLFNAALGSGSNLLDASFLAATGRDLDIRMLDMFGVGESIYDDAVNHGGAQFGIVNVTTPCIGPVAPGVYFAPGSIDINCSISAYSDPLHPSALTHRLIGQAALNAVAVAVPEPETYALLAVGLIAVLMRRSARRVG
jgi:outer membrane lipase/esterase